MNNKLALLLLAVTAAIAQKPDAFTGTWKLNVAKSKAAYRGGTRTYEPVAGGVHVTYVMTRMDGAETKGDYTSLCKAGKCTSEHASWTQKNSRTLEGQTFDDGKPAERYVRSVSTDVKTMTITFYPPTGKKKSISVQVWEKQ
jgi:hypothetical protein